MESAVSGDTTKHLLKYVLVTVNFDALKSMRKWILFHGTH